MAYDPKNAFARILRGELPANKVYEDDEVFAFHDINPQAPVHVLVIPKGEYVNFDDFVRDAGPEAVGRFFAKVREIAHGLGLAEGGYRLLANVGPDSNQAVDHLHIHIFGGRNLGGLLPRPR